MQLIIHTLRTEIFELQLLKNINLVSVFFSPDEAKKNIFDELCQKNLLYKCIVHSMQKTSCLSCIAYKRKTWNVLLYQIGFCQTQ